MTKTKKVESKDSKDKKEKEDEGTQIVMDRKGNSNKIVQKKSRNEITKKRESRREERRSSRGRKSLWS